MPISALGIVILFGMAIHDYGIFHLADYPIFLGIAAYLALTGLQKKFFGIEPIDIMRYATAVTLMWASVEKWAYPQWSYPIFITHPSITFGFDPEFYMRAAGAVEFVLAFALLWTPLVRRCAAAILAGMFIAACLEFGKIDTIGHSGIIAVLFAVLADDRRVESDRRVPLRRSGRVLRCACRNAVCLLRRPRNAVQYDGFVTTGAASKQTQFTFTISFIFGWIPHRTVKLPATGKTTVNETARLLIVRIERERRGGEIGVVKKIAIVVDKAQSLAAVNGNIAWLKFTIFLRNLIRAGS